jgi:hypothetical protein
MNDIKWQEPPADQRRERRVGKWAAIRAQLAERPNEWALVAADVSASMAVSQRRPGYEAVTRTRPEYQRGRADIYMRFVGGVSA